MSLPTCQNCRHWTPPKQGPWEPEKGECDKLVQFGLPIEIEADYAASLHVYTKADFTCGLWE